ncbi:MAG TPA: HK97 family phage prohead protease, partial [Candidatus Heimdallarchaeota archaeon]|nr:HK97 family phage prohead protease [Candidatus Heimdallarchaeota archaeon]
MKIQATDGAERRFRAFDGEMRAVESDDGAMIIEGYPIVYETYADLWGFREIIRKGAATEALKRSDELVLWDHESSQPMARRGAGTLEVTENDHGVFIRADVSKTKWGRDGYEAIAAGVINRMSFAFSVEKDKWTIEDDEDEERVETREVLSFDQLYDYSPVSYPAYE